MRESNNKALYGAWQHCYTDSRKNMYITSISGHKAILMSIYKAILLVHKEMAPD